MQRLGQHFLKNTSATRQIINKMIKAADVSKKDIVLEAGPGKGILTKALLKKAGRVIAVEKDKELVKYLKEKFGFVLYGKSLSVDVKSLLWADKIILVADDVPKVLFNSKKWKNKIDVWRVPDEEADNEKNINKSVGIIMNKIDTLNKQLEKK